MIKKNLRIITFVLILVILSGFFSGSLGAMSWPSEDAVLARNFGANDRGKPVLGFVFSGGTEILAAESGEVIFSRSKNDPASRLPSPLGAWMAIDHGDGLISIYSRYDDSAVQENSPDWEGSEPLIQVEKNQPIALSGTSGWSTREGFFFMLFDRRERRWINPAMIITPLQETRPVQIISVSLQNALGQTVQSNNLTQGRYTVIVNAAGGTALAAQGALASNQFAPQRILCSINGAEAGSLEFETVSARDGVLMVFRNGLVSARQIYANFPAFEAAEVFLPRGQATLEIIVQDISGNSRSVVQRLIVN
jgi:hypothetical protein